MKANELRIGNWINCLKIVDGDKIREISCWDFGTYLSTNPEYYSPIPLTEEWLLKFGFEKRDYNRYRLMFQGSFIQLHNVDESDGEPYTSDGNCTDWVCFYALEGDEIITPLCYPNYVHQLQNLYFALTGEELVLKE